MFIKINVYQYDCMISFFLFLVAMFSKRNRKGVLSVSIELYKHS